MRSPVTVAVALLTVWSLFAAPLTFGPAPVEAQGATRGSVTVPVTTSLGQGSFTITKFVRFVDQDSPHGLGAVGTLVVNTGAGRLVAPVTVPVSAITTSAASSTALSPGGPAIQQIGACDILHLTLGPIDLELLGLVVHLDQVQLDITAEPGPGNLLGNLLCAIAGLLDPAGGPLTNLLNQLIALLNQILGILG